jgi:soluble lytic murein transglycosylase-like protein
VNIKLGCWYLGYLFGQFKEPDKVLMAYNGGEGNVSSWEHQGGEQLAYAYPETQTYVGATLRAYQRYKDLYQGEMPTRVMPTRGIPARVTTPCGGPSRFREPSRAPCPA